MSGMNEGRRQSYLAALAIPLWSSRRELTGALPATPLEFAAFVEAGVTEVVEPAVADSSSIPVVPEALVAAVQNSEAPVARQASVQKTEMVSERATSAPADEKFPRFSCRVQRLAAGWLGVIAMDDVPDLSAQEYRLLGNIMQALGDDGHSEEVREHFRWPLSPNPSMARDAGAAREALAAFLARRPESARWLVLGETVAVYVRAALPGQTVIAAPSLPELLANPAAKRALWQMLHG